MINSLRYEAHDRRFAAGSGGNLSGVWRDVGGGAKTARVRFGDDGIEYQVGVTLRRFRNGGFWAVLVCPRCGGGAQRLRLIDDQPLQASASGRAG